MTSEGSDADKSPSPESTAGASEPVSGGYEARPIEDTQQPPADTPPAYATPSYEPAPSYEPPPPYDPTTYAPPPADQGYGVPGYPPPAGDPGLPPVGYPPPPPYGAAPGYPPPGYGAPGYVPPGYPPSGYGVPGYPTPGYGAPGYGTPGYAAQGYPPYGAYGAPAPKTNGLAIASLVASVISLCGLGSIAGIVLGVVALNQIKVSGESGRGLAIAGIVVGAVTLLFSLLWLVGVAAS